LERISGGTHPLTAVMAAVILVMGSKVNKKAPHCGALLLTRLQS